MPYKMKQFDEVSFDVAPHEAKTINEIARRAVAIAVRNGEKLDLLQITMDITAAHANGSPLRLEALLKADDFNFVHDVFGIRRNMNRETGQIEGGFRPRFAVRKTVAALARPTPYREEVR